MELSSLLYPNITEICSNVKNVTLLDEFFVWKNHSYFIKCYLH